MLQKAHADRPATSQLRQVVHIGQRKTATTWLQDVMSRAATAEGFRYQRASTGAWRRDNPASADGIDYGALTQLLAQWRDDDIFVSQEALIAYDHERMADAILTALPEAKILVTTRGPNGYLRSSYSNSVLHGSTQGPKAMSESLARKHMVRTHDFAGIRRAYGKKRVKFIPYELIRDDAVTYLKEVGVWFGVDATPFILDRGRNISPPPPVLELMRNVNERVAEIAPALRDVPEWRTMWNIAFRAVGHADALWDDFGRAIDGTPPPDPTLPKELWPDFRRMAAPLIDMPLYKPYLGEYIFA